MVWKMSEKCKLVHKIFLKEYAKIINKDIANIEGYGILKILTDFSIFLKESYNVVLHMHVQEWGLFTDTQHIYL